MLPLVVAEGYVSRLFVFGNAFNEPGTLAAALFQIGGKAAFCADGASKYWLGLLPSIADRPGSGLLPGLIGACWPACAVLVSRGIVAGFLAGYSVRFLAQNIAASVTEALCLRVVLPLPSTLITGLIMISMRWWPCFCGDGRADDVSNGRPLRMLPAECCWAHARFDLGGPQNKAAYTFASVYWLHSYMPMAAIMAAGMVPALGMGVATRAARKAKFNAAGAAYCIFIPLCFYL